LIGLGAVSNSLLIAKFLFSRYWQRANAARGTGESCLVVRSGSRAFEGSGQPACPDHSPVTRDYLEQSLLTFVFHFYLALPSTLFLIFNFS
jgi:hypothetical protein